MALGYEGYVQIGITVALGTGASVPRARNRIESGSGYGGRIIGPPDNEIGIGTPRAYDWTIYDGSIDMELNRLVYLNELYPWIFDRQNPRDILFTTRKDNDQNFNQTAFWNSINMSASDGSAVTASVSFVALDRSIYAYGVQGIQGFIANKVGWGVLCPLWTNAPTPLNAPVSGRANINPIPFWNTKVELPTGPTLIDFTNWTLDFSQDVVKFFGCTDSGSGTDPLAKEPLYLAVGPMTVTFSGSYMFKDPLGDSLAQLNLTLDNQVLKLKKLENTSVADDLQTGDSMVPLTVDYTVYDISQTP